MAGVGAGLGKSGDFDVSQKATMVSKSEGSGAQVFLKDNSLETIKKLLKRVRLIVICEMNKEDLSITKDVNEAMRAYNCHKKAWKTS